MTLMGGAAASEALIGGYIWTIGGCSTPQKQPRENAGVRPPVPRRECAYSKLAVLFRLSQFPTALIDT